jgi:hypothetical protein
MMALTPMRPEFSSYSAWIPMGFSSKWRGACGGCLPRVANGSGGGGCGVRWRSGCSGLMWCRRLTPTLLQLQEIIGKLHRGVLILLLDFNCGERRWICLRTVMAQLLGFFDCRSKLELSRGLFIGLLVLSRNGYGDQPVLNSRSK